MVPTPLPRAGLGGFITSSGAGPVIVCVVGLPGAGKTEFVRVAREEGLPVVIMGDAVRREAEKRGKDVGEVARELREKHGMEAVARLVIDDIRKHLEDAEAVVVDGVRNPEEVEFFEKNLGEDSVVVVAVHASPDTRYRRLRRRGREDDPETRREFESRDRRELDFGIGEVISTADVMIVNERVSLEEFRRECRRVLKKILSGELP
ncbi:MAG: flagellar hook-basal body complex protein FliE [Methanopyri archaeon]|nr:flagellar hook-basal body complex protein FliE [Methanopyri archaeon]